MKRQKKAFALLAAILMMASLLSIGVGAEGTAEREENRSVDPARDYVLPYNAKLRATPSTTGTSLVTISAGYRVRGVLTSNSGWTYTTGAWSQVTYTSSGGSTYTGYIRNDLLIPANKSRVVSASAGSATLYTAHAGYGASITVPNGKRACYMSSTSYNGVSYTKVRIYNLKHSDGTTYEQEGWIKSAQITIDYGYGN